MGKRQHQKDKMYVTATEWTTIYGGKKADRGRKSEFRKLPFHCCSLSLQPFEHPLCSAEGVIFDLMSIVPYLKKYGHNPITGEPMDAKSLIKLTFYKNVDGKYHCPVTFKVFNENSHIVAIRTSGNVYSYEAVERLNIRPRNFRDLLSDEPFKRGDIITLQDPSNLEKFDVSQFYHIKQNLTVDEEEEERARREPTYYLRMLNPETQATLEELAKETAKPARKEGKEMQKATARNAAHYSTGAAAQGFTSTVSAPVTENEAAIVDRDTLRYGQIKKKGYVRLYTSLGDLNLELHCDLVPKTCENFLKHCKSGFYNKTVFHRSIRNFMIQGGDPTGSGKGGESIWGAPFRDEFKSNLTHSGRGVLSMANSGPNTNSSQFFITFRSCRHLDGKHSVFGRVVGGIEVLTAMERVETTDQDRPKEPITITTASVFVDPYEEVDAKIKEDEEREQEELKAKEVQELANKADPKPKVYRAGVGKYIQPGQSSGLKRAREPVVQPSKKKKSGFGDFSGW